VTTLADPRTAARALVARTRAIAPAPDLLAGAGPDGWLWHVDGGGLAGRGVALRIDLPDGLADPGGVRTVTDILRLIGGPNDVGGAGTGPVALGALPFDRRAPGHLVVPAVTVGRDGDRAWVTTVAPAGAGPDADLVERVLADAARGAPTGEPPASPDRFDLVSALPHVTWRALVAGAVERIHAGELDKVVLARRVDVTANRPFLTSEVLERLIALYPACMVFRIDGFLGASPELLIGRRGRDLLSHPLAGTIARSGDSAADRALVEGLLASVKDRAEHAFVVDQLRRALEPMCSELDVPEQPSILELRNVSHLATMIAGRLRGDDGPSALELVAAVHPTPAVAGTPTAEATAYLQAVEGFDRDRYAGPVGWVDGHGDGTWALGIRSALVTGSTASMYAGVGVVADSDPAAELAETQLKLQALLAALVRP
jgi:menaquinone-specific isochorismate synthase